MNHLLYLLLICSVAPAISQSTFPCPDPSDITPCICSLNEVTFLMTLDCSTVASTQELQLVFKAPFPFLHFGEFRMVNDVAVKSPVDALPDGLFQNVTFDGIVIQNAMIDTIGNNLFEKSYETLNRIVFEGTLIKTFPFEHLSSFTSISSVSLDNNKLIDVANLKSETLTYLNLAQNPNIFIAEDEFENVPNLAFLDISYSGLKVIAENTFESSYNIGFINLQGNQLTILENNSFIFTGNSVNFLELSNNNIHDIQEGAIQGVNRAAALYFKFNQITTLYENVWRPIFENAAQTETISQIFLDGNPLDCSCTITWLVQNDTLRKEISSNSACANDGPKIVDLNPYFYTVNC